MSNSLVILIAILVGLTVGVLVLVLTRYVVETRRLRVKPGDDQPLPVAERLAPYLELIPLPAPIRVRWGTEKLALRLRYAGLPWDLETYARLHWALIWIMLLLAVWLLVSREVDLVGGFTALLLVLGGLLGPGVWLTLQADRRKAEIDYALPDFLDRLALGLEAGLGFEVALRRTSNNFPALLGSELRRAVRQVNRGHPVTVALGELSSRTPSNDMRAFVASVKQSGKLGTSLAQALRLQTNLLRARRRRRAQEASRRLPILIVFPLVFCFLPALLIIYIAPPILHLLLGQ